MFEAVPSIQSSHCGQMWSDGYILRSDGYILPTDSCML